MPKIFFITLAVDDLERSTAFYRDGLGWPTEGIVGQQFHDERTGADGSTADVDTIVLCAGQEPLRELQAPLEAAGARVHLIGGADVAAELDAKRAIDQGSRLAASL